MAALLTTAGIAHLAELDATWPPPITVTDPFDALILGQGNNTPALGDTQLQLTQNLGVLLRVATDYPVLGDVDPRNTGRASDRYTWKFTYPAGSPFVASNVALTNWNGGVLAAGQNLGVHEKVTTALAGKFDEHSVFFVNAKTGAVPTVIKVAEPFVVDSSNRVATWTARSRALRTNPHGSLVNGHRITTRIPRGHSVWTAALLDGCEGGLLRCDEVARVTLTEFRYRNGVDSARSQRMSALVPFEVVPSSPISGDVRWPSGTYNFQHQWTPLVSAATEDTIELVYTLHLHDRTQRRIEVEVRLL